MLTGAAVMNGALLLIAGNESCPQPQTGEHLAALEIIGVDPKNIVILQNKMDLVRESEAMEHCESIKKFVEGMFSFLAGVSPPQKIRANYLRRYYRSSRPYHPRVRPAQIQH